MFIHTHTHTPACTCEMKRGTRMESAPQFITSAHVHTHIKPPPPPLCCNSEDMISSKQDVLYPKTGLSRCDTQLATSVNTPSLFLSRGLPTSISLFLSLSLHSSLSISMKVSLPTLSISISLALHFSLSFSLSRTHCHQPPFTQTCLVQRHA